MRLFCRLLGTNIETSETCRDKLQTVEDLSKVADLPRTRKNGAVTERLAPLEAKKSKNNVLNVQC